MEISFEWQFETNVNLSRVTHHKMCYNTWHMALCSWVEVRWFRWKSACSLWRKAIGLKPDIFPISFKPQKHLYVNIFTLECFLSIQQKMCMKCNASFCNHKDTLLKELQWNLHGTISYNLLYYIFEVVCLTCVEKRKYFSQPVAAQLKK